MINTITLNPAIDRILYLNRLDRNRTNRIVEERIAMGGKGTHVSMNLATMGISSNAYGFGFGRNGRRLIDMLRDSNVTPRFLYDAEHGESRENFLIVESETKDATLVASQGPKPTVDHINALFNMIVDDFAPSDCLVLSGDTSNFTDPFIYHHLIEALKDKGPTVYIDASGETLKRAVELNPFLMKPNLYEMAQLAGTAMHNVRDLAGAMMELDRKYRIYAVVVSLGGDGSLARIGDRLYRVKAPTVNVYNTVGCGDCMMAGLLYGFEQGMCIEDTLRYATACSAAAAESPLSVGFDLQRAHALAENIEITFE